MRMAQLFVISILSDDPGSNKDTLACASALAEKSKLKCKNITLVEISYPDDFNMFNPIDSDTKLKSSLASKITNESLTMTTGADMVGAYVLGNFYRKAYVLEALLTPVVAKAVKSVVGDRLDKLCLVACGVSRHGKTTKDNNTFPPGNDTQNSGERCFIYDLCVELQKLNLTPIMAGWDDYVEVAYASRGNEGAIASVPGYAEVQNSGKKVVTVGETTAFASTLSAELRNQHKRVIKFVQGRPTWQLQMAGWSQK